MDGDEAMNQPAADFAGEVVHVAVIGSRPGGAYLARLAVRPRHGKLLAGAAEIQTASGRHYLVSVLGDAPAHASFLPEVWGRESDHLLRVVVIDWEDTRFGQGMRLIQSMAIRSAEGQLAIIQVQAVQSAAVRLAAIEMLSALGSEAPVEPLLRALDDENRQVRWSAARALAGVGDRAPLKPFLTAIRDKGTENQGVRIAAAYVLGAHPMDAPVEALVELLHDANDGRVRAAAAHACGRLGARAPIAALVGALRSDDAFGNRMAAAQSLGELGDHAPVEPLIAALDDPQRFVGVEAARALLRLGDRVRDEAQERARHILEEHREFEQQLSERDREIQVQNERGIEPKTLDGWLSALQHPEWQTRASAIQRIAELGERAPLEPLLAALHDDDPNVQIAAAEGLESLGGLVPLGRRVADALFAQLDDFEDDEEFAAERAIEALAAYLPLDALLDHLGDLNWYPRETALKALVQLGPAAPVAPLLEALGDAFNGMRPLAAEALVKHHREAIEPALKDAERVLMGEVPVGPVLTSLVQFDIARRIGARRVAAARAVGVLTELLSWPFWQVRWQAIQSLGELDTALPNSVIRRLRELCTDHQSSAVRESASGLLERRGLT